MQNVVFWREFVLNQRGWRRRVLSKYMQLNVFKIVLNIYNLTVDLVVRMMFCVFIYFSVSVLGVRT